MLLARMFDALIVTGRLTLIDADGRRWEFGDGDTPPTSPETHPPAPHPVVRLHDRALHWKLALNPGLYAGEAYMDGTLTLDRGGIHDLIALVLRNAGGGGYGRWDALRDRVRPLLRWLRQINPAARSRRNVAHHYDLSEQLYALFLDPDLQYSCAYFTEPGLSLEEAQAAKKRHIAAKLLLRPGQRVLDIGCGWGGLALHLARTADVEVTGVTLSREQLAVARRRAEEAGLSDRVRFELADYRQLKGRFDRIFSVGMFEHVGLPHYGTFFAAARRLLSEDGVMLLHAIGRLEGPGSTSPWLRRYIFPGGYSPALSEVLPAIERSGLYLTDMEILRLHYAETLRHWRERFLANRERAARLYDERFCRMWEFYLAGCESAFRYQGHMVWQAQLTRRVDAVPLTRDYVQRTEAATTRAAGLAA